MKNFIYLLTLLLLTSCVSTRKYKSITQKYNFLQGSYTYLQSDLKNCNNLNSSLIDGKVKLESEIQSLLRENSFLKENNNQALKQLQELSVISAQQAENIKKSLDNIGGKDAYIQNLHQQMAKKDSLNMALVMNLKGAVGNINDTDINIKVEKGVVYVDISDKLLFKTGRYDITENAKNILGKVAAVLKNQPNIEFMVEGHTDDVSYSSGVLLDNWDLSVKRATSVVRILQYQYGLNPENMIAAGRSEYKPVIRNTDENSRAINRRTRIIIIPQLDQFFKLLEPSKINTVGEKKSSATRG